MRRTDGSRNSRCARYGYGSRLIRIQLPDDVAAAEQNG